MTELGTKVRDCVTGFSGVATARVVNLSGPPQVFVERVTSQSADSLWIDEARLEPADVAGAAEQAA